MGQELNCRMHYQSRTLAGKAEIEGGMLRLDFPGGPASIELGAAAVKWAHKILHPPSRAEKLGIKPGLTVRLAGSHTALRLSALRGRGEERQRRIGVL